MAQNDRSAAARKAIRTMRQKHGAGYFRKLGLKAAQTRKKNGN